MPPTAEIDAAAILGPLRLAFALLRDRLQARLSGYHSDHNPYWHTVEALAHASEQTLRASLFLVGDKRLEVTDEGVRIGPFPAQAITLQRSLIEGLANLLALSEEPKSRDALISS